LLGKAISKARGEAKALAIADISENKTKQKGELTVIR
jgi:hypothetical protein